ncbi:MAG: prepilin-type N-terminal cleavage/methylation domain-containing protein [Pirellulales bacterium]|nr:prepilin-type N-terminal cleavage/methylation domain-containing protein [Pirellulales bacterium]
MHRLFTNRRCGLTLLEIIVAVAVLTALMVVLWNLINVYTGLREKGEEHVDRVGDVAVLMQQLEQDLRSLPQNQPDQEPVAMAEPVPSPSSPPLDEPMPCEEPQDTQETQPLAKANDTEDRTGEPLDGVTMAEREPSPRNMELSSSQGELARTQSDTEFLDDHSTPNGLVGDERSLTLTQIDRDPPRQVARASDRDPYTTRASDVDIDRDGLADPKHPEHGAFRMPVRLVRYWLVGAVPVGITAAIPARHENEPCDPDLAGHESARNDEKTGLFREEYIATNGMVKNTPPLELTRNSNQRLGPDLLSGGRADKSSESEFTEAPKRKEYHLSQVEWAAFRYFDGFAWRTSWDSRESGQLPVAVEMSLWLARRSRDKNKAEDSHRRDMLTDDEISQWIANERPPEDTASRMGYHPGEVHENSLVQEESNKTLYDGDGSVRLPEVRQLVVLRSAVPQRSMLPDLEPATPRIIPPRRPPHPARAFP